MLERLKITIPRQIGFLLLASLISLGFYLLGSSAPRTRLTVDTFSTGVMAGVFITLLFLAFYFSLLLIRHPLARHTIEKLANDAASMSGYAIIGAGLVAGFAEELLLRGYIFRFSFGWHPLFAYALVLTLSAVLYAGRPIGLCLLRVFESLLYCLLWEKYRSLVVVALAHSISEMGLRFALKSAYAQALLSEKSISLQNIFFKPRTLRDGRA